MWALVALNKWLSDIVTIGWELAWANSELAILSKWSPYRGGLVSRFDSTTIKLVIRENSWKLIAEIALIKEQGAGWLFLKKFFIAINIIWYYLIMLSYYISLLEASQSPHNHSHIKRLCQKQKIRKGSHFWNTLTLYKKGRVWVFEIFPKRGF